MPTTPPSAIFTTSHIPLTNARRNFFQTDSCRGSIATRKGSGAATSLSDNIPSPAAAMVSTLCLSKSDPSSATINTSISPSLANVAATSWVNPQARSVGCSLRQSAASICEALSTSERDLLVCQLEAYRDEMARLVLTPNLTLRGAPPMMPDLQHRRNRRVHCSKSWASPYSTATSFPNSIPLWPSQGQRRKSERSSPTNESALLRGSYWLPYFAAQSEASVFSAANCRRSWSSSAISLWRDRSSPPARMNSTIRRSSSRSSQVP